MPAQSAAGREARHAHDGLGGRGDAATRDRGGPPVQVEIDVRAPQRRKRGHARQAGQGGQGGHEVQAPPAAIAAAIAAAATAARATGARLAAGGPLDGVGGRREHAGERGCARAAARVRFERTGACGRERARKIGAQVSERARRVLVALPQLVRRAGTERIRAGQGLVDHHADGPHVGRGGRSRALAGLGRHVRERAEHAVVDRRVGLVERGDAEVEHAHGAVAAEQDVRGLHVAVHHAVLVRMRQTGAHGGGDAQERRIAELPLAQRAGEVHALDDIGCDVDVLAVLVDAAQAHDVRVPELARDGRLAPRALAQRRVVRDRLERHDLLAQEIERAEHRPGSAHAEDAVDPEAVADHPRGEQRGACLTSGFRHQETAPGRGVRGRSGGSIGASCKGSDIRSGPAEGAFAPGRA